jgi:hypothetical protein
VLGLTRWGGGRGEECEGKTRGKTRRKTVRFIDYSGGREYSAKLDRSLG